jgi:N-methylhydantoinase A/oxoprolinase/acetone carboxylase beta subunit
LIARIGIDTGGTYTDAVTASGTVLKVLSSHADPAQPVRAALGSLGGTDTLAHGTTVATNALLQRRGGTTALVSSAGQRDIIEIARQVRPSLYDQWEDRPEPLVPRHLRFEIEDLLDELPSDVDAVAVCLLHSDIDPSEERRAAATLGARNVVLSSDVSPEYREYERAVTTVADAFLRLPCEAYLADVSRLANEVLVMTSAGGLVPIAGSHPVSLLLSGPAGGVLAASAAALAAGFPDCVTLDMGGTSTDVCLVRGGRPEPAAERRVAGLPIRMPALDIHTIGAGGGSIAAVDPGGALAVGPQSAGAEPGPACYGRGGVEVTVTDADLLSGRLPLEGLPGLGTLDKAAAEDAMNRLQVDQSGVIAVVDEAMVQAIRVVSVRRGIDPIGLALVAFGGAGPLHACALADALRMPAVVVPPRAGVLSAVGILGAPRQDDRVRSCPDRLDHAAARKMADELTRQVSGEEVVVGFDCRYAGQSHELTVPDIDSFHDEHLRRSGYALDAPVEVVAVRVSGRTPSPIGVADLPVPERHGPVTGPAVIAEPDCTIWVESGWKAEVHQSGSWILTRHG